MKEVKIGVIKRVIFTILSILLISIFLHFQIKNRFQLDDQQFFWTLSSLVQSFASLVGIVIVFIVFKFQYLADKRKELLNSMIEYNRLLSSQLGFEENIEIYSDKNILEYCEELEKKINQVGQKLGEAAILNNLIFHIRLILKTKENFKEKFIFPFAISCGTILVSIMGLTFEPIIRYYNALWAFIIFCFTLASWSLFEIVGFIRNIM